MSQGVKARSPGSTLAGRHHTLGVLERIDRAVSKHEIPPALSRAYRIFVREEGWTLDARCVPDKESNAKKWLAGSDWLTRRDRASPIRLVPRVSPTILSNKVVSHPPSPRWPASNQFRRARPVQE